MKMTPTEIRSLCSAIEAETGVNPRNLYCLATGNVVGRVRITELQLAVACMDADDMEEIRDELYTRTLAFTRPSPAWNYMRRDSLNRLRITSPMDVLAYSLNRLYDPVDTRARGQMTFEQRIAYTRAHIELASRIRRVAFVPHQVNRLLLVLLEIDATFGLHSMNPPASIPALDTILNPDALEGYIACVESWGIALRAAADRALRESTPGGLSRVANRLAAKAYVDQFNESSEPSPAKIRAAKKRADRDEFAAILDSIMSADLDEPAPAPVMPTGIFTAGTARPRFGVAPVAAPVETI